MAVARKQRQAQKLQEQAMSKALAESKTSASKISFGEDDDEEVNETHVPATNGPSDTNLDDPATLRLGSEEDSEDDDAPIEVVSNKTSRKQASADTAKLKAQEKAEKAKRQAVEAKKAKKAQSKKTMQSMRSSADLVQHEYAASENSEEQEHSDEEQAGPSSRLDPSLFAEVFSQPVSAPKSILKKRSAEERADEVAQLQRERKLKRKKQRAGGVVKGRDGLPMKEASDGTVLRALNSSSSTSLHKKSFDDDEANESQEPLDTVVRPEPLDRSISLPNVKVRSFKNRTIGKRGPAGRSASAKGSGSAKKQKSEDDPLGLNDPAFLPGGEFHHLMNKGEKVKGRKPAVKSAPGAPRQAYRGGGVRKDAVSVLRARSRGGPSVGFARSQEDDDDY